MNDDKMDTGNQAVADAQSGDPISEACSTQAEKEPSSDLAGSDEGKDAATSCTCCESFAENMEISADPVQDSDSDLTADSETTAQERIEQLRSELMHLRAELAQKDTYWNRMAEECEEFRSLYPDTAFSTLPDSVWQDVRRGIPIAAAYALAEKKRAYTEMLAEKSNADNQKRSSGSVESPENEYFSPGEVRSMSPAEVRKNYQKIMQSMQKWH